MPRSLTPELRALNQALYRFPITKAPRREHCLCAHVEQTGDPTLPSSKKLIYDFEEGFLKVQDPKWHYWRTRRLKGFQGQLWWEAGRIKFSVRSPEIPFFGLRASFLLPGTPIAYSSRCEETGTTPTMFFLDGEERQLAELDSAIRERFLAIADGQGVIRTGSSLEPYL